MARKTVNGGRGVASAPEGWDGRIAPKLWAPIFVLAAALITALGIMLVMNAGDDDNVSQAFQCPPGRPDCVRQPVHWHADFALFIRGQQLDFNKPEFFSTSDKLKSPNVHIHENPKINRSTVVHVHREQTTWDEFFASLGFQLTDSTFTDKVDGSTCLKLPSGEKLCNTDKESFKFFVNGVQVDGIALSDITDIARVLVSYGPETAEQARAQYGTVTDMACILSESCKARIDPNEPPEDCSKSSSTCN